MAARDHVAVSVYRNGELVVTIETNALAGRDLQPGDDEAIREAARHLLGFVGAPTLPTYDEIQIAAELVACVRCGNDYYSTRPTPDWICIPCRRQAPRDIGAAL